MTQRKYRMSSAGECPRALSAEILGQPKEPTPSWLQEAAEEGKWHEDRIVQKLIEKGYPVKDRQKEFTISKDGFELVGHIDGVVTVDSEDMLLEIKSMSQYEFERWKKGEFLEFLSYADQVSCYMEASKLKKALYVVKNRSSGYTSGLSKDGIIDPRNILKHTPSDPNIIYSKLAAVEMSVAKNKLYPAEYNPASIQCRRCFYRNIVCLVPDKLVITKATEKELLGAIKLLKEGKAQIEAGEALFREGKETLGNYLAITTPESKSNYKADGATVSRYRVPAYGDAVSYPKSKLVEIVPEEYLEQVREYKAGEWRVTIQVDKEEEDDAR